MHNLSQLLRMYQHHTIALYGLGIETKKVLKELGDKFHVAGLLDGYRQTGHLYGTPVISIEQAVADGVKMILVVARPGSCKAIAKRIGKICLANRIDLMDIRGNNLCEEAKVIYDFRNIRGMTRKHLLDTAETYDVISVDLFDTLIMRRTLFPEDICEIVDYRLKEKGIVIRDFCKRRLASEKVLSQTSAPQLVEIYSHMLKQPDAAASGSTAGVCAQELAELEWSVDYELAVPRLEMCDVIKKLYQKGKTVYIVSDTYYTGPQIEKILGKCGIDFYSQLMLSCQYQTGKTQRLFGIVNKKICGQTCIHIGDDSVADVKSAQKNKIVPYKIYSGTELLEMAGYLGMWNSLENLSDRIRAGMFSAVLFNSPFQFELENHKIAVNHAYDTGYLFFAPMISDFVIWLDGQIKSRNLRNVWFCSRDGYLIRKLYDLVSTADVETVYFLTSRMAAIRAGMEDERDIRYVGEMKFSGTLEKQLTERFGIRTDHTDRKNRLLDYKNEILEQASVHRKNYMTYIGSLKVEEGEIAFFDFVAKGTGQMYISRLTDRHLKGFYFLWLEEEDMKKKGLDILPFYKKEEKENSVVFDDYYILETMLTAPEPSVLGFDSQGKACYAKETRKKEDIACMMSAQNGIEDYLRTYKAICPQQAVTINKKLDEILLSLIHKIVILDQDFLNLQVEDPFFNRMTDITDLI